MLLGLSLGGKYIPQDGKEANEVLPRGSAFLYTKN